MAAARTHDRDDETGEGQSEGQDGYQANDRAELASQRREHPDLVRALQSVGGVRGRQGDRTDNGRCDRRDQEETKVDFRRDRSG